MPTAYVITCNDSVEAVVIDDLAFAQTEMDRLKAAYIDELTKSHGVDMKHRAKPYWAVRNTPVLAPDAQRKADQDARLAASAPKLLETLYRIAASDPKNTQFAPLVIAAARDAIEEAEGE